MTAKDLKALEDGTHQIRVFGMSRFLQKTTYNVWHTQYIVNDNILINIHPVDDSLFLTSCVQGINFVREILNTDLVII